MTFDKEAFLWTFPTFKMFGLKLNERRKNKFIKICEKLRQFKNYWNSLSFFNFSKYFCINRWNFYFVCFLFLRVWCECEMNYFLCAVLDNLLEDCGRSWGDKKSEDIRKLIILLNSKLSTWRRTNEDRNVASKLNNFVWFSRDIWPSTTPLIIFKGHY